MDGILSQDEINALLASANQDAPASDEPVVEDAFDDGEFLTDEQKDAIGEISNISISSCDRLLTFLSEIKLSLNIFLLSNTKNAPSDERNS